MQIVLKPVRNSQETLSTTQNLIILRNLQYRPKFLVSYKSICVLFKIINVTVFSLFALCYMKDPKTRDKTISDDNKYDISSWFSSCAITLASYPLLGNIWSS